MTVPSAVFCLVTLINIINEADIDTWPPNENKDPIEDVRACEKVLADKTLNIF